jgi:hypothetical protein
VAVGVDGRAPDGVGSVEGAPTGVVVRENRALNDAVDDRGAPEWDVVLGGPAVVVGGKGQWVAPPVVLVEEGLEPVPEGAVEEARALAEAVVSKEDAKGASVNAVDSEESSRARIAARRRRKDGCGWTGRYGTAETAPIINLLITVDTQHKGERILLEESSGEWLVLLL